MDFAALSEKITNRFSTLSPQLQLAARYVLDRPDDVALNSMRSLAARAGVHPSTMVRLARAFDCDGYQDFREPFQERLRERPDGYLARARSLQKRGAGCDVSTLLNDLSETNSENFRATLEQNGVETFKACAKALEKGRRVFIVGLRSVFPVTFFFHYAYRMFRDDVILLDGRGGTFADELRNFGRKDVIFAVSFDPYTHETVRAVDYGKERGGTTVILTDSPVSPLAKNADHVLIVKNESPSFFHSIAAAISTVEALVALLVARGGKQALKVIEHSEGQLESFDAYWHGKPAKR